MSKVLMCFLMVTIFGCSTNAEDVPESSHIEASDTINYRKVMASHSDDLRTCFEKHSNSSQIVQLTTIVLIAPSGRVSRKSFKSNHSLNDRLLSCLSDVVDDMDFNAPSRGGTIEVTHISKFSLRK